MSKNKPERISEKSLSSHKTPIKQPLSEQQLSALHTQFMADISHELITPLTALKLYVEAIQDNMFDNDAYALQRLENKVNEFEQLIETWLAVAASSKDPCQSPKAKK